MRKQMEHSNQNNLKNVIENELAKENESLAEKFKQMFSFGNGVLKDDNDLILLEEKLKKFIPSSFINIVEEPEQNLFPTSQQRVINSLLEFNNKLVDNKLIITNINYFYNIISTNIFW